MRNRRELSERLFRLEQEPVFEPFDVVCIKYGTDCYQKGIITRVPDVFYNRNPKYHYYVYDILVIAENTMWIDEGNNEGEIVRANDLPNGMLAYNDDEFNTFIRKLEYQKSN